MAANSPHVFFSKESLTSVPWLMFSRLTTFFLYFGISIIIVRHLSKEDYGIYSLISGAAEYLMLLCNLGMNFSLLRFIPELFSQRKITSLKRFLIKIIFVQLLAIISLGLFLVLFNEKLSLSFHIDLWHYLPFLLFIVLTFVLKEFMNNALTAIYLSKILAFFSLIQALAFLAFLTIWWWFNIFSVDMVILAYGISILMVCAGSLYFFINKLNEVPCSGGRGVGKERLLKMSLPVMARNLINKLMEQYGEIFFIAYFLTPVAVGYYSLGNMIPQLMITFIPLSLYSLFTAAFSEAYSKSAEALPELIKGIFQILMIICLPIGFFGLFFSYPLVIGVYGSKMQPAAKLTAFFFGFKLLTLIWIPLGMAVAAKEKIANTLWIDFFPLFIALPLDYMLIGNYGISGALAAITITFWLTLPVKLWWLKRILGGIYFPFSFFFRIGISSFLVAGLFYLFFGEMSPWFLIPLAPCYSILLVLVWKILKLIHPSDVEMFKTVGIPKLNRWLDLMTHKNA